MARASIGFTVAAAFLLCVGLLGRYSGWWDRGQGPTRDFVADVVAPEIASSDAEEEGLKGDPDGSNPVHSNPEPPTPAVLITPPPTPVELDSTLEPTIYGLPAAFMELVQLLVTETNNGNHAAAALVALDAIEISREFPEKHEFLHQMAGLNYEQAGIIDFAVEQYRLALALNPDQRSSYEGLRRLDSEFRSSHPPLPDPVKAKPKPASLQSGSSGSGMKAPPGQ